MSVYSDSGNQTNTICGLTGKESPGLHHDCGLIHHPHPLSVMGPFSNLLLPETQLTQNIHCAAAMLIIKSDLTGVESKGNVLSDFFSFLFFFLIHFIYTSQCVSVTLYLEQNAIPLQAYTLQFWEVASFLRVIFSAPTPLHEL